MPRNIRPQTYDTPSAFKAALEARLRGLAQNRGDRFERMRMTLIFERFLARLAHQFPDTLIVKGGLALELRLARARTTKDIDLRMVGSSAALLPCLQDAAHCDLGDFLRFDVMVNADHPTIVDAVYEGARFKVICLLGGKRYGAFGVDIGFGDPMFAAPDELTAPDLLDFIGVSPPRVKVYPPETHLAEKLHAYTLPRNTPNARVKDLPDLALLGQVRSYQAEHLRAAFAKTFDFRGTHPVPTSFPPPPGHWTGTYARIADNDGLPWPTLAVLTDTVRRFLDPVLTHNDPLVWSPTTWAWTPA